MTRYITPPTILRTDEGKRIYSTVIPDTINLEDFPYEYEARVGDRWDTIAYKYLGSATLWYRVANYNNSLNGSIFIKPGTIIKIPEV
jgi:hypothetical protein